MNKTRKVTKKMRNVMRRPMTLHSSMFLKPLGNTHTTLSKAQYIWVCVYMSFFISTIEIKFYFNSTKQGDILKHPQDESSLWDRAAKECCICLGREVEKCSNVSECFAVDPGHWMDTAELHVHIQYRLNTCTQIEPPLLSSVQVQVYTSLQTCWKDFTVCLATCRIQAQRL